MVQLPLWLLFAAALPDRGIYPELDGRVTVASPASAPERALLRVDLAHQVLTLYDGDEPLKAYPLACAHRPCHATAQVATVAELSLTALLGADDADELARLTRAATPVAWRTPAPAEDADGDGIVDRIDIVLGAKKLLYNRARYFERYVALRYPGGDVPRGEGVCTDTVIRALRNAGIDLQKEVHEDILRAPGAYPMVDKTDASINHRRVKTLLPWFKRHFVALPSGAPYLPGDIVFFHTALGRPTPDHVGVVSDTRGRSGLPLVINNWAPGAVDAEMDLLPAVPVTDHFRAPQAEGPRPRRAPPRGG
jgi:uncharacterized protein YijF (DUF1287 family)